MAAEAEGDPVQDQQAVGADGQAAPSDVKKLTSMFQDATNSTPKAHVGMDEDSRQRRRRETRKAITKSMPPPAYQTFDVSGWTPPAESACEDPESRGLALIASMMIPPPKNIEENYAQLESRSNRLESATVVGVTAVGAESRASGRSITTIPAITLRADAGESMRTSFRTAGGGEEWRGENGFESAPEGRLGSRSLANQYQAGEHSADANGLRADTAEDSAPGKNRSLPVVGAPSIGDDAGDEDETLAAVWGELVDANAEMTSDERVEQAELNTTEANDSWGPDGDAIAGESPREVALANDSVTSASVGAPPVGFEGAEGAGKEEEAIQRLKLAAASTEALVTTQTDLEDALGSRDSDTSGADDDLIVSAADKDLSANPIPAPLSRPGASGTYRNFWDPEQEPRVQQGVANSRSETIPASGKVPLPSMVQPAGALATVAKNVQVRTADSAEEPRESTTFPSLLDIWVQKGPVPVGVEQAPSSDVTSQDGEWPPQGSPLISPFGSPLPMTDLSCAVIVGIVEVKADTRGSGGQTIGEDRGAVKVLQHGAEVSATACSANDARRNELEGVAGVAEAVEAAPTPKPPTHDAFVSEMEGEDAASGRRNFSNAQSLRSQAGWAGFVDIAGEGGGVVRKPGEVAEQLTLLRMLRRATAVGADEVHTNAAKREKIGISSPLAAADSSVGQAETFGGGSGSKPHSTMHLATAMDVEAAEATNGEGIRGISLLAIAESPTGQPEAADGETAVSKPQPTLLRATAVGVEEEMEAFVGAGGGGSLLPSGVASPLEQPEIAGNEGAALNPRPAFNRAMALRVVESEAEPAEDGREGGGSSSPRGSTSSLQRSEPSGDTAEEQDGEEAEPRPGMADVVAAEEAHASVSEATALKSADPSRMAPGVEAGTNLEAAASIALASTGQTPTMNTAERNGADEDYANVTPQFTRSTLATTPAHPSSPASPMATTAATLNAVIDLSAAGGSEEGGAGGGRRIGELGARAFTPHRSGSVGTWPSPTDRARSSAITVQEAAAIMGSNACLGLSSGSSWTAASTAVDAERMGSGAGDKPDSAQDRSWPLQDNLPPWDSADGRSASAVNAAPVEARSASLSLKSFFPSGDIFLSSASPPEDLSAAHMADAGRGGIAAVGGNKARFDKAPPTTAAKFGGNYFARGDKNDWEVRTSVCDTAQLSGAIDENPISRSAEGSIAGEVGIGRVSGEDNPTVRILTGIGRDTAAAASGIVAEEKISRGDKPATIPDDPGHAGRVSVLAGVPASSTSALSNILSIHAVRTAEGEAAGSEETATGSGQKELSQAVGSDTNGRSSSTKLDPFTLAAHTTTTAESAVRSVDVPEGPAAGTGDGHATKSFGGGCCVVT